MAVAAVRRRYREKKRNAVFAAYGSECVCCESTQNLQLDHIVPWDESSREPRGSTDLYHWLVKNDFPLGFQVLCRTCNAAKGRKERCNIVHRAKQPLTLGI